MGSNVRARERGASMIEVSVSVFVVSITLMAAAMTMGVGVSSTHISQEHLIAKQKAREALESVFTARNTQNIAWADIRNVGGGGIFLDGWQGLREAGTDGISNTSDDAAAPMQMIVLPGSDGYVGTQDDQSRSLNAFERRIMVSDIPLGNTVDPDIREIVAEVRFSDKGIQRTVRVSALISRFS